MQQRAWNAGFDEIRLIKHALVSRDYYIVKLLLARNIRFTYFYLQELCTELSDLLNHQEEDLFILLFDAHKIFFNTLWLQEKLGCFIKLAEEQNSINIIKVITPVIQNKYHLSAALNSAAAKGNYVVVETFCLMGVSLADPSAEDEKNYKPLFKNSFPSLSALVKPAYSSVASWGTPEQVATLKIAFAYGAKMDSITIDAIMSPLEVHETLNLKITTDFTSYSALPESDQRKQPLEHLRHSPANLNPKMISPDSIESQWDFLEGVRLRYQRYAEYYALVFPYLLLKVPNEIKNFIIQYMVDYADLSISHLLIPPPIEIPLQEKKFAFEEMICDLKKIAMDFKNAFFKCFIRPEILTAAQQILRLMEQASDHNQYIIQLRLMFAILKTPTLIRFHPEIIKSLPFPQIPILYQSHLKDAEFTNAFALDILFKKLKNAGLKKSTFDKNFEDVILDIHRELCPPTTAAHNPSMAVRPAAQD